MSTRHARATRLVTSRSSRVSPEGARGSRRLSGHSRTRITRTHVSHDPRPGAGVGAAYMTERHGLEIGLSSRRFDSRREWRDSEPTQTKNDVRRNEGVVSAPILSSRPSETDRASVALVGNLQAPYLPRRRSMGMLDVAARLGPLDLAGLVVPRC